MVKPRGRLCKRERVNGTSKKSTISATGGPTDTPYLPALELRPKGGLPRAQRAASTFEGARGCDGCEHARAARATDAVRACERRFRAAV